ncbi:DUF5839 family protein [Lentilactobacillus hilgardii]|uniref:DUF5839 family protein n=1 Tax=Lentilactobacillus hilgardii TaxID=1588 RepID=UPI0021C4B012|nr:DUF5839 family protein [Lentilactobacillus hilgardii]MCP9334130.1 hypothetical protein [Lentilactobacillus hilgardii]MCP9350744.1 hypothetical protein [Lentilactobacillus hilgardii]MCP9353607.1 hypothetical protein [Lentilactobacillus hilgardii]
MVQTHRIETVINGHHLNRNGYFSPKNYQWRVRHHQTRGVKNLALGQLAWVEVTGQPKPVLVIITGIHTLTDTADRQAARQLKTVKSVSVDSVKHLNETIQAKFDQYMAVHPQGDGFDQPQK